METTAETTATTKRKLKAARSKEVLPDKSAPLSQDATNGNHAESHAPAAEGVAPVPSAADLDLILTSLLIMRNGDFSVRLPVAWTGLKGKIADTFNDIIAANEFMASELKRVGQAMGKEGRTRERTHFQQSRGSWGAMEVSVNTLVEDLLRPTTEMTRVIASVAQGNLTQTVRLDVGGRPLEGEFLRSAKIVNTMIQQLSVFTAEVTRVAREVGTDGKLGGQARVPGVAGTWKDLTDSVNSMANNLTGQVRNIVDVATAVASGDLSRKITVDVRGEILQLKETLNTMVDQLNRFAVEVTRVAREVGTEGKLGGQAQVSGVAGTWKDLTDSVNFMAGNLTAQVRNIVEVSTAIAKGDLSRKITVDVRGEVLELKDTINNMVDQLNGFAGEVTRVAREVGTEGKLGGQAQVPGAAGTWKDLTGNVNLLADNLTNQVRAIAEVAIAVTKGDLTRSIQVDASGEVADLKDNLNTMIDNLRLTTDRNTEQDWLKTNLARFASMLQGQRELTTVGRMLLSELSPLVNAQQGVLYQMESEETGLSLLSSFANSEAGFPEMVRMGEGLVGQCALDKRRILLSDLPDTTVPIRSGLFEAIPRNVIVLPVLFEDRVKAVIELASLGGFTAAHLAFLEQLTASIGIVLNSIETTMQTEGLLKQAQQLAVELQTQQKELRQTNEQLAQKAQQLAEQNAEVERKNQEIEQARGALEEKAKELALTSKYKSEFLANMSHELRTPLNSILVLGQQLAENPESNLSAKQVEFARTIHGAGTDLLNLISDILDLSKIESGTVSVEAEEVFFGSLIEMVARPFRHEADNRKVTFEVVASAHLTRSMVTDSKRVQQVLKNLLSNAFKFTEQGGVLLTVSAVTSGWTPRHPILSAAASVIAFEVADTGIGIPLDKQRIVFEAFQQASAGTSRKYGGTGLGLAISRELAGLLGGEIQLQSQPGKGSTFTLYLPLTYVGAATQITTQMPRGTMEMTGAPMAALPTSSMMPLPNLPPIPSFALSEPRKSRIADDREHLQEGDAVLLIIEDDERYAQLLCDLSREKGFKVLVSQGGAEGLELAREFHPTAISLDVLLPDMLGWTVLNYLKQDPATRHIPVQMLTVDEDWHHALSHGAFAFVTKPTSTEGLEAAISRIREYSTPRRKHLLVVEDDPAQQLSIKALLGYDDIEVSQVVTGADALKIVNERAFDCLVLDLRLPDMTGFDLLEQLQKQPNGKELPVVVFTGKDLSPEEDARLHMLARSVIVKDVESPERLLDETALFLHRVVKDLPIEKQNMLDRLHRSDEALIGRKVLVVDDDVRNVFALSSVLERRGISVLTAGTGREAIEIIEATPDLGVVLMDIMMPEMDGYETMQLVRQNANFRRLPIIALTAKAMKGDREKCLEAGASDYLAKPVNTEQLLAALRMWLHR